MSKKDIRQLLARFMEGQTSIEEEDMLAEYFRTNDVPDDMKDYKEMFSWFDEGMPMKETPATDAETKTHHKRRKIRRIISLTAAAAAVAALLIITVWPKSEQPMTATNTPISNLSAENRPSAHIDTLAADTANTVMPKKKRRRRGIRRDRYKPMPPKVYIAEARTDTVKTEVEAIAEEKIKETEMRQNETLKNVYENYKRIEANVDLYLTALENYDIEEEFY